MKFFKKNFLFKHCGNQTCFRCKASQTCLFLNLILISLGVFIIALRINIFRYNNFDYGKFDLGNMSQMLWTTLHGRFMYLTDYFGTNLPRWSMSHVDPILLIFLPLFMIFPSPMTLVVSQLILVIFSSLLIFLIADQVLESKFSAFLFGLSFLFYPAVGFLIAWTGFHGVTAAIPFFLLAFYVFERMYKKNKFTKKGLIIFWLSLILVILGKEQLSIYTFLFGFFVWTMRGKKRLGSWMMGISMLWLVLTFLVIIPYYSRYRIEGYKKFSASLGINTSTTRDVLKPNYFLSRYEEFGDTYTQVAKNMILNPDKVIKVVFGGDKTDNFRRTFEPLMYTPFLFPMMFVLAIPDLLINYSTTAGGIGTSEIYNHRISMIVPVLFIASIYGVLYISKLFEAVALKTKIKLNFKVILVILSFLILLSNIYTSYTYNNPVYQWLTQSVLKRLVFAKSDTDLIKKNIKIGDIVRLSRLENKDRECAQKIVKSIPVRVSVSGPDYLGAHLSMRETYAIFPALYNEADYVIVDVFSQKILRILDADLTIVRDVAGDVLKNPNYKLSASCGNLFVFKKVDLYDKEQLLPLQEINAYPEKYNFEIFQSLFVVDYNLPTRFVRDEIAKIRFVYTKKDNNSLNDYVLFTTFVNKKSGELYQLANLPSFGLSKLGDWAEDKYYSENLEVVLPSYIESGDYMVFVGLGNNVRTRSLYLGDIIVL